MSKPPLAAVASAGPVSRLLLPAQRRARVMSIVEVVERTERRAVDGEMRAP